MRGVLGDLGDLGDLDPVRTTHLSSRPTPGGERAAYFRFNFVTDGFRSGGASGGALSVPRNATSAAWSAGSSPLYFPRTVFASPPCARTASRRVGAEPSCM